MRRFCFKGIKQVWKCQMHNRTLSWKIHKRVRLSSAHVTERWGAYQVLSHPQTEAAGGADFVVLACRKFHLSFITKIEMHLFDTLIYYILYRFGTSHCPNSKMLLRACYSASRMPRRNWNATKKISSSRSLLDLIVTRMLLSWFYTNIPMTDWRHTF